MEGVSGASSIDNTTVNCVEGEREELFIGTMCYKVTCFALDL